MSTSNGLRLSTGVLLDYDEIQWLQAEIEERQAWLRLGMAHEVGWVGDGFGANLDFSWGWVVAHSGSGRLEIDFQLSAGIEASIDRTRGDTTKPRIGVDRRGYVLELLEGTLLQADGTPVVVPDDSTWYTLLGRRELRLTEPGTLTLTAGSTTVVGVGTQFTRYSDSGDPKATLLRVDAADSVAGNEGQYEIDTVTDDTHATLASPTPAAETGVAFRVQGRFFGGTPADPDTHNRNGVSWSLVARTTTRPTVDLVAYDVHRTGATVTFIDRRNANVYQPIRGRQACYALMPSRFTIDQSSLINPWSSGINDNDKVLLLNDFVTADPLGFSVAPSASGSHLAGLGADHPSGMLAVATYDDGSTVTVRALEWTQAFAGTGSGGSGGFWANPDNGSTVTVVAATGIKDADVLAVPADSGATHLCFFVDTNGSVQQKASADNGATWGVAVVVWNPPGAERVSRVDAVLTRMGRIVLVGAYSTGNRLRYVFSDDLGTTWDNNSQNGYGYGAVAALAAVDVSIVEDDRGNLWTVAAVDQTNGIRLYRGASEGTPVPDSSEEGTAWVVGPEEHCASVDAIAFPNGTVGAFCSIGHSSGARSVSYVQLGRRRLLYHQVLVDDANGSADTGSVQVAVGLNTSGMLHLAWSRHAPGAGTFDLTFESTQFAPVEVGRPHTWIGGL